MHLSVSHGLLGSCLALAALLALPLAGARAAETPARPTNQFLDSIGIVTTFPDRGQPLDKTIDMVKYCGFRWVRGGRAGGHGRGALQP